MKKLSLVISNRFWKRRLRAFNKNRAKPIKELRDMEIEYLERYYNDKIWFSVVWVAAFALVRPEDRLRIMNSRLFAEWMVKELSKEL